MSISNQFLYPFIKFLFKVSKTSYFGFLRYLIRSAHRTAHPFTLPYVQAIRVKEWEFIPDGVCPLVLKVKKQFLIVQFRIIQVTFLPGTVMEKWSMILIYLSKAIRNLCQFLQGLSIQIYENEFVPMTKMIYFVEGFIIQNLQVYLRMLKKMT